MTNRLRIIAASILVALPLLAIVGVTSAQSFRSGDNISVSSDDTVDSTLWASGRNIDVAGTVDGDIFCAGLNVTISGTVVGDVICAAQNIRISGTVEGDVRVAAQSVAIGGDVQQNASVATQSFSLEGNGVIGNDLSLAATDAAINGTVGRDFSAASENITISSEIGRNVKATVDRLNVTNQATVSGELTYTSSSDASIAEDAQIAGGSFRYEPEDTRRASDGDGWGFGFAMYALVSMLFTFLILALLFPRFFQYASDRAVNAPLKTVLVGFLTSVAVPVLIVLLMITVIGLPLGLLLFGAWMLVLFLSVLLFGYYIGRLLLKGQSNVLIVGLVGVGLTSLILVIPFIGALVLIAAVWMGVGMIIRDIIRVADRPRYDINYRRKSSSTN